MKEDEINTTSIESTEAATRRKRQHFARLIILILLGVQARKPQPAHAGREIRNKKIYAPFSR